MATLIIAILLCLVAIAQLINGQTDSAAFTAVLALFCELIGDQLKNGGSR